MSDVLFGLRSNCSWFAGPGTRAALISRVKNAIVLHDTVHLQDGTFASTIGERNSADWFMPPGTNPDRSRVVFYEPGGRWGLRIKRADTDGPMQQAFEDTTIAVYRADFYPILEEAGLLDSAFVTLVEAQLDSPSKLETEALARVDSRDEALAAELPPGDLLRDAILKGLHYDTALSLVTGLPLQVDPHCMSAISHKVVTQAGHWTTDGRGAVHSTCVALGLPNFGALEWDEVCEIRESAAGRDYRQMVDRASSAVVDATQGGLDQKEAEAEARLHVSQELVEEITQRRPGIHGLAFNVMLNLVPYGGVFGTAGDTIELLRSKRSWISLLRRP